MFQNSNLKNLDITNKFLQYRMARVYSCRKFIYFNVAPLIQRRKTKSSGKCNENLYVTRRFSHDLVRRLFPFKMREITPCLLFLKHAPKASSSRELLLDLRCCCALWGIRRICFKIPTNRSSTLWFKAAETSMYLQSNFSAIVLPSAM